MILHRNVFILQLIVTVFIISANCKTNKCGPNEVEVNYASTCYPQCPSRFRIGIACVKREGHSCVCKEGWVYANTENKTCIPEEFCPQIGDTHTEFSNCSAACQQKCDCLQPTRKISAICRCDRTCVPGYICENGYVKNETGYCVTPNNC